MPTELPSVFIGSSSEGLDIAREVELHLSREANVTLWTNGIFVLGEGSLESLVNALDKFDFAVLVLSPDDLLETRGENFTSPRDNVLFELGLFMGRLGRRRTIILSEEGAQLKLPSDLNGITRATYRRRENQPLSAVVSPSCTIIINSMRSQGKFVPVGEIDGGELFDRMAKHIDNYLLANRFKSVSFERVRTNINASYTDELLLELIDRTPDKYRRVRLSGGRPAIGFIQVTPRALSVDDDRLTVWIIGSYTNLTEKEQLHAEKLVSILAKGFANIGIRVVMGQSNMGAEFAHQYRDAAFASLNPPPPPIILPGTLRRGDTRGFFLDAIGRVPDIALVIGGNRERTRVLEEAEAAKTAGIAVLALPSTGGVAAQVGITLPIDAELLTIITDCSRPLGSGDMAVRVLEAFRSFATARSSSKS
jgi:predicted nucleotide-binding protein with TIR-like domain